MRWPGKSTPQWYDWMWDVWGVPQSNPVRQIYDGGYALGVSMAKSVLPTFVWYRLPAGSVDFSRSMERDFSNQFARNPFFYSWWW